MSLSVRTRRLSAILGSLLLTAVAASGVAAHETRTLGDYLVTVGFIGEPVYLEQKTGLEIRVLTNNEDPDLREPVADLHQTLTATITKDGQTRTLPLAARFGAPGWYQAVFYPTVEGNGYEIKITGTINDMTIDETFVSGPETFGVIHAVTSDQFPVQYPSTAELVADVQDARSSGDQVPLAIGLAAVAAVLALLALGLAITGRRRAA